MKNLGKLTIYSSLVTDLTPIKNLPITWLTASHNRIKDLKPLEEMTKLLFLNISEMKIDDISPLWKTNVTDLWIDNDDGRHTLALTKIPKLRQLNGTSYKR